MSDSVVIPREELEPRVLAGAAVLDLHAPTWFRKINKRTLAVRSAQRCVLAQVFDGYDAGMLVLGWELDRDAVDHGCYLEWKTEDGRMVDYSGTCEVLNELWIDQIDQRLSA